MQGVHSNNKNIHQSDKMQRYIFLNQKLFASLKPFIDASGEQGNEDLPPLTTHGEKVLALMANRKINDYTKFLRYKDLMTIEMDLRRRNAMKSNNNNKNINEKGNYKIGQTNDSTTQTNAAAIRRSFANAVTTTTTSSPSTPKKNTTLEKVRSAAGYPGREDIREGVGEANLIAMQKKSVASRPFFHASPHSEGFKNKSKHHNVDITELNKSHEQSFYGNESFKDFEKIAHQAHLNSMLKEKISRSFRPEDLNQLEILPTRQANSSMIHNPRTNDVTNIFLSDHEISTGVIDESDNNFVDADFDQEMSPTHRQQQNIRETTKIDSFLPISDRTPNRITNIAGTSGAVPKQTKITDSFKKTKVGPRLHAASIRRQKTLDGSNDDAVHLRTSRRILDKINSKQHQSGAGIRRFKSNDKVHWFTVR